MTISTIIRAIKNAFGIRGNSGSKKPPSNDPDTVRQWVKGKLKALARMLGKLGLKALAALPQMIGGIVSWVLGMLKKPVGFTAEHTYAFIALVCSFVLYWIYEQITKKTLNFYYLSLGDKNNILMIPYLIFCDTLHKIKPN